MADSRDSIVSDLRSRFEQLSPESKPLRIPSSAAGPPLSKKAKDDEEIRAAATWKRYTSKDLNTFRDNLVAKDLASEDAAIASKALPPPIPTHSKPVVQHSSSLPYDHIPTSLSAPQAASDHTAKQSSTSTAVPPDRFPKPPTRLGPQVLSANPPVQRGFRPEHSMKLPVVRTRSRTVGDTTSTSAPTTPRLQKRDPIHTMKGVVHRPPPTRLHPATTNGRSSTSDSAPFENDSGSDLEDAEYRPAQHMIDDIPDATFANRRPPEYRPACHVEGRCHLTAAAAFNHFACIGTAHHLHAFNLSTQQLTNIVTLSSETKRITAVTYRADEINIDAGRYVWAGTKEGDLIEVDMVQGKIVKSNNEAHRSAIVRILRCRARMITIDQDANLMIWQSGPNRTPPSLNETPLQRQRLDDYPDFCDLINGSIWSVARAKDPRLEPDPIEAIRVHTFDSDANRFKRAQTVSAGDQADRLKNVGSVCVASIVPERGPHIVFLGHETGHITLWQAEALGRFVCIDVRRISTSRITALQGVSRFLWAGFRSGVIQVYDTSENPWRIKKVWQAHSLAVADIIADPACLWTTRKLPIVTFSLEGAIHVYNGFMDSTYFSSQLSLRQPDWCSFRNLKILLCSFNLDSAKPNDLLTKRNNQTFFDQVLQSSSGFPDIIVFGFQELVDLQSKSTAAKSFLFGRKKADVKMQEAVSHRYQLWKDRLTTAVQSAYDGKARYTCVVAEILVGLFTCIFVRDADTTRVQNVATALIKTGFGGIFGNKGAILARFQVDDSSFCFINCHLAAGQSAVHHRSNDLRDIFQVKQTLPPVADSNYDIYVKGGDGTHIFDHETIFLNGDLNYRIDLPRPKVLDLLNSNNLQALLDQDQLNKLLRSSPNHGRNYPLKPFSEAPITFQPTYKYDTGTHTYDTSDKNRVPAWCDRILWCTQDPDLVHASSYQRYEVDVSDHRPVSAHFKVRIKRADPAKFDQVHAEVGQAWTKKEDQLVAAAQEYYRGLI